MACSYTSIPSTFGAAAAGFNTVPVNVQGLLNSKAGLFSSYPAAVGAGLINAGLTTPSSSFVNSTAFDATFNKTAAVEYGYKCGYTYGQECGAQLGSIIAARLNTFLGAEVAARIGSQWCADVCAKLGAELAAKLCNGWSVEQCARWCYSFGAECGAELGAVLAQRLGAIYTAQHAASVASVVFAELSAKLCYVIAARVATFAGLNTFSGLNNTFSGLNNTFSGLNSFAGLNNFSGLNSFGGNNTWSNVFGGLNTYGYPTSSSSLFNGLNNNTWSSGIYGYPTSSTFGGFANNWTGAFGYPTSSSFGGLTFPASTYGSFANSGLFGGNNWFNTPAAFQSAAVAGDKLYNIAFRPSSELEMYTLTNPIRMIDVEGNRQLYLAFELKGYKPEEVTVTLNKAERAVVVEAAHEVKEGKEHHVARKYSRKFVLPETLAKIDLTKVELKSCLTQEGYLVVECQLPKMTTEEIAKSPIMSELYNKLPFAGHNAVHNFGGFHSISHSVNNVKPVTVKTA